jgi:hypothetical protein
MLRLPWLNRVYLLSIIAAADIYISNKAGRVIVAEVCSLPHLAVEKPPLQFLHDP